MTALSLTATPDGVLLQLKVSPGSAREGIRGIYGDRLKVAVRTPPEKGRANRSVLKLLETALGVARGALEITSGHTSSAKTVLVRGATPVSLSRSIRTALAKGGGK